MKKKMILWLVLALFVLSAFPAMADEAVTFRKSILVTGEYQRYMPFPFQVTSVNCGNLETSEFKKGSSFFGVASSWEKKYVGENVQSGWYRFNLTGADLATCAPVMDFSVEVPMWTLTGNYIGGFMEFEPEDLGLLVRGKDAPNNFFNLSVDDRQYSYDMVIMAPGTERELASFAHNTQFFSDTGNGIVGAIVADNRGFLIKKVMFNLNPKPATTISVLVKHRNGKKIYKTIVIPAETTVSPEDNVILREGDVIVLIRKEM